MFGKHFQSMYTGSMVGQGSAMFAVWGYVISHMRPDDEVGAQVELNPKLIAMMLGEKEDVVIEVIKRLCSPDPNSRTPEEEGRKLVQLGTFDYRVVNGAKYIGIKNEEARREANRARQQKFRDEKKNGPPKSKKRRSKPVPGEVMHQRLVESGATQEEIDRHSDSLLPEKPATDDPEFPA